MPGLIDTHHLLDLHQLASIVADHVLPNTPGKEDCARKGELPLILFQFFNNVTTILRGLHELQLEMPRHAMCLAIELATTPALVNISGTTHGWNSQQKRQECYECSSDERPQYQQQIQADPPAETVLREQHQPRSPVIQSTIRSHANETNALCTQRSNSSRIGYTCRRIPAGVARRNLTLQQCARDELTQVGFGSRNLRAACCLSACRYLQVHASRA